MNYNMNSMKKKYLLIITILVIISLLISIPSYAKEKTEEKKIEGVNEKMVEFRKTINFYTGYFAAGTLLISTGLIIFHLLRLSAVYNHPLHRRKVLADLGVILLGISLLGSVGLILGLLVGGWFPSA